jgi:tetratricopeptide (TPR) repeat protein
MAASEAGDTDHAITLFRQAVNEDANSPLAPFLLGAELAQLGRIEEALQAYAAAVLIAPDFHIARYQMGLLQFTSGHAALALVTWQPLFSLPEEHALRAFVGGFAALASDLFDEATHKFRIGQALNADNAPLNADIQLVIDRIEALNSSDAGASAVEDPSHVLLSNYRGSVH